MTNYHVPTISEVMIRAALAVALLVAPACAIFGGPLGVESPGVDLLDAIPEGSCAYEVALPVEGAGVLTWTRRPSRPAGPTCVYTETLGSQGGILAQDETLVVHVDAVDATIEIATDAPCGALAWTADAPGAASCEDGAVTLPRGRELEIRVEARVLVRVTALVVTPLL